MLLRHQADERLNPTYSINPLNAELNPIRHLLALVGGRHIVHVSRVRVKLPVIRNIMYNGSLFSIHTTDQAIPNICTKLQSTKFKCSKYLMLHIIGWIMELEVWESQQKSLNIHKAWLSLAKLKILHYFLPEHSVTFSYYKNSEILWPLQDWFSFN